MGMIGSMCARLAEHGRQDRRTHIYPALTFDDEPPVQWLYESHRLDAAQAYSADRGKDKQ